MTLSRRTTIAIGLTLLMLFAGLYAIVSTLLLQGFRHVEDMTATLHVERAQQSLELASETISQKLADWASWDDCYEFAVDGNQEFTTSNLAANSLANLGLRFIVFMHSDRTLARAYSIDPATQMQTAPPQGLIEILETDGVLVQGDTHKDERHGLLRLPEGLFVIGSRPVLNSRGEGPPHGILVFGHRIDDDDVARMAERLRSGLSLIPIDHSMTPEQRSVIDAIVTTGIPRIHPVDGEQMIGIGVARDLLGAPIVAVEVTLPRFVYQQALTSTRLLLATLAIATFACVGVTLLVLRMTVLSRLAALHADVAMIGRGADLRARVSVRGHDELSDLATTVNMLLERVATSREELAHRADELQSTSNELVVARDAAEGSNRSKSEFLANMSHEVRTPMTAILGYADLLAEQIGQPGFRPTDCVETIRRNARHLLTIINDILDLSKIEAGRMQVERLDCCSVTLGHEVVELLRENAANKGLNLQLRISSPIPATIHSDPTRLRQILLNLAGNAIKFTREGSVTIDMRFDRVRGRLITDVIDTGIGIRPEQARQLFSAFSQADASTSRVFGGTGLGLAISHKLAQLLGGALELTETNARGSTFRLEVETGPIPANAAWISSADERPVPCAIATPTATPSTDAALSGLRLLLAEDGPDNQRLISFLLRKAGALVELANDGRAAVDAVVAAAARHAPFDLVLMDMQMPVLDGYGATRELRDRGFRLPILALTAHAMEGDRNQCLAAGCDEYASKPIHKQHLIDACSRLGRRETTSRQAA